MKDDVNLRLYNTLLNNNVMLLTNCSVSYCYIVSENFDRRDFFYRMLVGTELLEI